MNTQKIFFIFCTTIAGFLLVDCRFVLGFNCRFEVKLVNANFECTENCHRLAEKSHSIAEKYCDRQSAIFCRKYCKMFRFLHAYCRLSAVLYLQFDVRFFMQTETATRVKCLRS